MQKWVATVHIRALDRVSCAGPVVLGLWLSLVGMVCAPGASAADAIVCAQASHRVEKLVCADGLLVQLDIALNMNYQRMLYSPLDNSARAYLRRSQRDWVKRRNQCADASCVQRLYEHRVDEVCDYPVPTGVHAICDSAQSVIDNWRAQAARGRE